jgi:two-component system, NtrC family, sensor kinase
MAMPAPTKPRILIVDDNPAIHADFTKILASRATDALDDLEAMLFETAPRQDAATEFELVTASQGQEALAHVVAAQASNAPFAVAFVDMRMPPGWDGLETIERLWAVDPSIQIVICSAYSDYSWSELRERLGPRESLLILKKPFDTIEVVQCAHALTTKWELARAVRAHVDKLEAAVAARTAELREANENLSREMRERERIETELRLSQRLEAVGQLAAGIAHEINTPLQYVGDHLQFVCDATTEMLNGTLDGADISHLSSELPPALESMQHGLTQIRRIVHTMKELAHPGPREATKMDIVRALRSVLDISHAAYRYVADLETDFQPIPEVSCHGTELNQVFVNLIVNAAHAMESRKERGKLRVSTRVIDDDVEIAISDTGVGIDPAHRERIFDAFFTTKEVGRGTGQGLAISRSIVVDRHGGKLTFDTKVGVGTTFYVRIPIEGRRLAA